jgi:hypothetical protein
VIITQLIGGLGNQMFQYAAGKALSLHHNVPLLLDKTHLEKDAGGAYTQRYYELDFFNVKPRFAGEKELEFFGERSGRLKRVLLRMFPGFTSKITLNESGHLFYGNFFRLPSHTYLKGFWQSEKYFKVYERAIRQDFVIRGNMPEELKPLEEKIRKVNSISMHVRRGDYVTLKNANEFHGLCSVDYYRSALGEISAKENSEVFVFSDNMEWCCQNLKFEIPVTYVSHTFHPVWDMHLMSLCSHNIIANSSFSWWAAWLNTNPQKKVIAPEYWFTGKKTQNLDLLPEGWLVK